MSEIDFDQVRAEIHETLNGYLRGHLPRGCGADCRHAPAVALAHLMEWAGQLQVPGAPFFWPAGGLRLELEIARALKIDTGVSGV